jgi:Protein of unknown function (DUF2845)
MNFLKLSLPFILSSSGFALSNLYCPHGSGMIRIGMNIAEVSQLCGMPATTASNTRVVQNLPITRLSYNNFYKGPVYYWNLQKVYQQFSVPSSSNNTTLTVDIYQGKVKSMALNGTGAQSTTACNYKGSTQFAGNPSPSNNTVISVGDSQDAVFSACGSPDTIDNTYIQVPVSKNDKPEVWTYQFDPYSPKYKLIFIQGNLQSIDQL